MLVLSRKLGERIRIGADVYVEVLSIDGQRIKLGVVAPPETKVLRCECDEKKGMAA